MTRRHADPQQRSGDGAAFTVRAPLWLRVLFSRNPLIRVSDRLEAFALVLTFAVSLLAAPAAGAIGTAVYGSRTQFHAAQAQGRTEVTATVLDAPARSDLTQVHARWFAAGVEHTGKVHARTAPKPGETVEISVNRDGSYAGAPQMSAAREAVFAALAVWLNVTVAAGLIFIGVRKLLRRSRYDSWRPELADVTGEGRGHISRP